MYLLAFAESVQLFPDGSLFLHILFILGMIWVLNRTLFRPINAIIESRLIQKDGRGGEAGEILDEVSRKQSEYEKMMLAARNESYAMIEAERTAAMDAHQRAVGEAKADAAMRIANEKSQIKEKVAEAKVELALEANKMADKIAANILSV
jgi:F0F1-type ATP synthase membrane subunit b/b'